MRQAFAWPIVTLDFEASGLGEGTYPIEVGVARWHGPGTPIRMWSSLISTTDEWRDHGVWKDEGFAIHGIRRDQLEGAPTPRQVMDELNRLCPIGTVAFCDGGEHDKRWLQALADAAETAPRLLVGSWGHIVSNLDDDAYERLLEHDIDHEDAHRAGPDARDHLLALAHAIGAPTPTTTRWTQCRRTS